MSILLQSVFALVKIKPESSYRASAVVENSPARGPVVPEPRALKVVPADEPAHVERRVHGDEERVLPLDAKHVRLPVDNNANISWMF